MRTKSHSWQPSLTGSSGPVYLAIAAALAADIASGRLGAGEALPTHRALAAALGVNFTTVTRAYEEAHRRGLIEAVVGRGTFVRRRPHGGASGAQPAVDMGMNMPPQPESLRRHVTGGLATLQKRPDFLSLLTYLASPGSDEARAAGAQWVAPQLGAVTAERVLVCSGAQAALLVLLTSFVKRDEVVLTEALTYPGMRALAAHLGVRLAGIAMDQEGIIPSALEAACARENAKVLYCIPTIQNPTTATMSLARREAILAIARRRRMRVFEDDAYGMLLRTALPPLAALAPDIVFHIAGLAKCMAPGLRIAYLTVPTVETAHHLAAAIRATTQMAPPLMAALAAQWIADGTARALVADVRRDTAARQRIARQVLPEGAFASHPEGHHIWLTLPAAWNRGAFENYLRMLGLAVVPSDAFAVGIAPPEAVRISLGAAADQGELRRALGLVAEALGRSPASLTAVV